ncbi:hypothetical protein DFH08DRAFT_809297 [Mycena albidolilacea]|uniref:Uncharacterized protein n=1 Tax=Mycena albidolilacea TaxID=1033008 RepID=A0AAD7A1E2_9AGAR|nr:hypothetical protein DFH08DRAFT_809297 [Mycena albidolilacea]
MTRCAPNLGIPCVRSRAARSREGIYVWNHGIVELKRHLEMNLKPPQNALSILGSAALHHEHFELEPRLNEKRWKQERRGGNILFARKNAPPHIFARLDPLLERPLMGTRTAKAPDWAGSPHARVIIIGDLYPATTSGARARVWVDGPWRGDWRHLHHDFCSAEENTNPQRKSSALDFEEKESVQACRRVRMDAPAENAGPYATHAAAALDLFEVVPRLLYNPPA